MDTTLLASVAAPLVGWLIVGGWERRREERTLWMLQVAAQLSATSPAAHAAREVAEKELSTILERRGTTLWRNLWVAGGVAATLAAVLLLLGALIGPDAVTRVGSGAVGVLYIGMAAWAFRHLGEVNEIRRRQRPTRLVLPSGRSGADSRA